MTIVTVFSCFERLLGFIYRIFLSRALGSEGVGIYQIALSVVGLLMTITASGIPVTVSRIMIKNEAELQNPHYENTVFSGITAVISYFIIGGKVASPMKELKPLIASSAPITLMRTATSLINTLIAIILPARLVAGGLSSTEALSGFGELSGMSIPLIFIPSTVLP